MITRGGDYLRVWRLDGVAFECADEHQIAERHEALCSLLRNLAGGQWAVWTHRLHRVVSDSLQRPGAARLRARPVAGLPGQARRAPDDEQRALPDAGLPAQRVPRRAARCNRRSARAPPSPKPRPRPCA
ncbi:MAG: hypothetical protein MZW92_44885 [Comamonadaceae bacterium]|nr:hypothetical protein [Comamonadaceae bacterium]